MGCKSSWEVKGRQIVKLWVQLMEKNKKTANRLGVKAWGTQKKIVKEGWDTNARGRRGSTIGNLIGIKAIVGVVQKGDYL